MADPDLRRRAPLLVLVVAFVTSRVGAHLAGVRFDAEPLQYATQLVDPDLLQDRLVESTWYLHSQPPLYNLVVGSVLRWSPLPDATSLHLLYLAVGLALLIGLYALGRELGVPRWGATAIAVVIGCGPPAVLYESWLSYEHPVACLLVWQTVAVARWVRNGHVQALVAVAGLGAAATLSRSLMHPIWLVAVVALALVLRRPERWRPALVAAGLPLLLVAGVMGKNQVVFGSPELSSWFGFNVHKVAVGGLPVETQEALRAEGVLDAPLAAEPCEPEHPDVPVLAEELERGPRGEAGIGNANWECLRAWYAQLADDAAAAARAEPGLVARSVAGSAELFAGPSTFYFSLYGNRNQIDRLDTAYRRTVLGDVAWDPPVAVPAGWATVASAPDQRLHLSLTLVAATLADLAGAAVVLVRWRRRRPGPGRATVLAGGLTIGFVTLTAIVFEHGENHRIRYVTEPLTLALAAGATVVVLGRWWRQRSNGRPAGQAEAASPSPAVASSENASYSSPVSAQSSNWMTPSSPNFVRSQPSPASSRPSFLQFGTIFEKSIIWNICCSGAMFTTLMASLTGTPMRSHTSCWRKRSRMRTAASKANSWRSRISAASSSA